MTTAICRVDGIRLERDDRRWENCSACDSDGDPDGVPETCLVCTSYELQDVD
jgi:hypothetical protein